MPICSECGKTIANTNPRVHYGVCAVCDIPDLIDVQGDENNYPISTIVPKKFDEKGEVSEAEEQMISEEANHDLYLRDQTAKSMVAWLVDWGYVEIKNTDEGSCIIPSDILKTGKAFKRESLLMGDGEPTTADKYNKEWIDNEKTKT